jgi:hypothetical protein
MGVEMAEHAVDVWQKRHDAAESMYLTMKRVSLKEIASQCDVDGKLLRKWIADENWQSERRKVQDAIVKQHEEQLVRIIAEERLVTVDKHLKLGRDMEDIVQGELTEMVEQQEKYGQEPDAKRLLALSKAAKNAADITARASGGLEPKKTDRASGPAAIIVVGADPKRVSVTQKPAIEAEVINER